MIENYLNEVSSKLDSINWLISHKSVKTEKVSSSAAIIKGEIVFIDGSILDFREMIISGEADYRFHYMNKKKELIKRWDTAPHHRELSTFPCHLHIQRKVIESEKMNFLSVIEEIKRVIFEKVLEKLK